MASTSPINNSNITDDTVPFDNEEDKPEQDVNEVSDYVRTVDDCTLLIEFTPGGYMCKLCGYCECEEKCIFEHALTHFPFRCSLCRFCTHSEEALLNHAEKHVSSCNEGIDSVEAEEIKHGTCENDHIQNSSSCEAAETNGNVEGLNGHSAKNESDQKPVKPEPSISSRVKVYKCRQCLFTAPTKEEFWNHQRHHIRPDKILECPKCAFVTEYKHHLEYHLRNHIGSKPFKCTKCQYACVNLSMLRSHMKSHLKQSQFRCATCPFSSRSFSSLQVHLDKENHQAADIMVMDEMLASSLDFRSRRTNKRTNSKSSPDVYLFSTPQSNSVFSFAPNSFSSNAYNNSPQFALQGSTAVLNPASHNTSNILMEIEGVKANIDAHLKCGVCEYSAPSRQAMNLHLLNHAREDNNMKLPNGSTSHSPSINTNGSGGVKFEPVLPSNIGESDSSGGYPHIDDDCRRRKRKGKAHKLVIQPNSSNEYNSFHSPIYSQLQFSPILSSSTTSPAKRDANVQTTGSNSLTSSKLFECEQCDILFRNFAMYCTHKMFHSANDPFCCSQCGGVYPGQVDFFIHVAQEAHELR